MDLRIKAPRKNFLKKERAFRHVLVISGLTLAMKNTALAQEPIANTISLSSLLEEMLSRDAAARWPQPSFTVRQASSYDRSRLAPDKPGWFGNNDGSNYLRSEEHDGHQEQVMMDADGPGAIVRFHLTNAGSLSARLRLYLDGSDQPALTWPSSNLMDNQLNLGNPLVSRQPPPLGHGAATLYLPIPYAKHCKITLQEGDPAHPGGRFYHIDYRTYPAGTPMETFSFTSLQKLKPLLKKVDQALFAPAQPFPERTTSLVKNLDANAQASIDLPSGPNAVRQLELTVGAGLSPALREQALRSVVLRADFDEENDAIWCPTGDFSGSGAGGRPLASWYRDVNALGDAVCRWTMPYRSHARFTLQNLSDFPVSVKLTARTTKWSWDDRSLYFHCNWHQQTKILSDPPRDWNLLAVQGRGILVGDVLSVFNPIPSWYGEGNEKIWVDDESFPSHIGTGTEDYYNASWAPNPVYQTPFTNHPRIDDPLSQGQNVYTRTRNLDTIPFNHSLRFDFEIMTWKSSEVDYAATTYWYGAPGAKANWGAAPAEAKRPVPVITPNWTLPHSLECEALPVMAKSDGLVVEPQDMHQFNGTWSGRAQLLIRGRKVGDFVELAISVAGHSPRRLTLYATRANDYATLQFSVNGQKISGDFDGYAPNPTPLGQITLGVSTPKNGRIVLRAEVIGANVQSRGDRYLAALDAITIDE